MLQIPLASAYLCPNCSCIGNCSVRCPACASSELLSLAGVLDREPEDDPQLSLERPVQLRCSEPAILAGQSAVGTVPFGLRRQNTQRSKTFELSGSITAMSASSLAHG